MQLPDDDGDVELHVLRCRLTLLLGTNCDQCRSMVQCCFTSTETVRLIRTERPGRPPRSFTQLLNSDPPKHISLLLFIFLPTWISVVPDQYQLMFPSYLQFWQFLLPFFAGRDLQRMADDHTNQTHQTNDVRRGKALAK